VQSEGHADRLEVKEERHLQTPPRSQSSGQEHIVTYSPQHTGLGPEGLCASFEMQRVIFTTHRRHPVSVCSSCLSSKVRKREEPH